MPIIVDRDEARHLVGAGAQLVEVLPEREYAEEHRTGNLRRAMLAAAVVLLVGAALWRPVAVPQLVKFPAHLDETTRYRGPSRSTSTRPPVGCSPTL